MKKYYVIAIALIMLMAFVQPSPVHVQIKGTYNVPPIAGEKIYLTINIDIKKKLRKFIDSAVVTNNQFFFDLQQIEPGKYELGNSAGKYFPIYLDKGQSEIVIDSHFIRAKVRGNITDSLIKRFDAANNGLGMVQMGFVLMAQKYKKEGKEIPDSLVKQLTASMEQMTALRKELSRTVGLRKDMAAAYVLANGGYSEFTTPELNDIYAGMPAYVKEAKFGMDYKTLLDKINSTSVGVKVPDFTQKDPEGRDVQLAGFIKGKKLVLIDFWASWCGPCRKENPNVLALYKEYKSKGFDIIGVSLDSKKDDWVKAIADDGLTWAHVSDLGGWKNAVAQSFNVTAVPHTLLVDGRGVIVAKNLRGKELEAKVAELCK